MRQFTRRKFIKVLGGAAAVSAIGFPMIAAAGGKKQVVIVGGVSEARPQPDTSAGPMHLSR